MDAIELDVSRPETRAAMTKGLSEHSALLVLLDESAPPALNTEVDVALVIDGSEVTRAKGRLVQLLPGGTGVVLLDDAEKTALLSVDLESAGDSPDDGDGEPGEEWTAAEDDENEPGGGDRNTPLWAQFAAMSKQEKIKLARHGSADARRLILKDRDQSLHQHVLNNPGLTTKELASFVSNKLASPAFIKRILERSEWMQNMSVVEALVFNPHTPTRDAVKLVPRISLDAARRITKMQNLREPVVRAARQRVHRTGR